MSEGYNSYKNLTHFIEMEITRLSSKGQVIIPKSLRDSHGWEVGQELIAVDMGDGILLKPKKPFEETAIEDVAGSLKYDGNAKTLDEMDDSIRQGILEQWHDRD